MSLEEFNDSHVSPWRAAVERTPISPGPAGGPEYVATPDKALGKLLILRRGGLFMPLLKARTKAARFLNSDLYEGVQTNSFLGVDQLNDSLLSCLDEIPRRSTILLHLPSTLYKQHCGSFRERGYRFFRDFCYHKVSLTGSFDEWFMRPSVSRGQIRKAIKRGVEITIGGNEMLDDFYEMYLHSFKRWRGQQKAFWYHPGERFARMFDMPDSGTRIALARLQEKVIGAGLICAYSRTSAGLYGGIDYHYRDAKPSNLIYAEVIRRLAESGVEEYNMGTSNDLKNVESFKESLGAVRYKSVIVCRHRFPRLHNSTSRIRSLFAEGGEAVAEPRS
jgi:hypothetical protein